MNTIFSMSIVNYIYTPSCIRNAAEINVHRILNEYIFAVNTNRVRTPFQYHSFRTLSFSHFLFSHVYFRHSLTFSKLSFTLISHATPGTLFYFLSSNKLHFGRPASAQSSERVIFAIREFHFGSIRVSLYVLIIATAFLAELFAIPQYNN